MVFAPLQYIFNNLPGVYVPGRLDKYRKVSVISGISLRIAYLLMAQPRRRINIELLLGISATFLSLAALVVSIFQTKIAREQQQASVWPYLQTPKSHVDDEFSLNLANDGVGPAIIKNVEVYYQGKLFDNHNTLFRQQLRERLLKVVKDSGKQFNYGYLYGSMQKGNVLKSGDSVNLLSTVHNERVAELLESVVNDTSFHLRIQYADVYGNCWQLDRNNVTSLGKCSER